MRYRVKRTCKQPRRPLRDRFEEKYIPEPNSGCWLWTGALNSKGYGLIGSGGRGLTMLAHHASLHLSGRLIPKGTLVCHTCDVTACVNPSHLFIGTALENSADNRRKRRRIGAQKLTAEQVSEVRALVMAGATHGDVASRFGVCRQNVGAIANHKTWRAA
jgi:hypothetical protein